MSTEEIEVKRRQKVNSRDNSATNSTVSSSSSSSSSGSSRSSIASTKSEEDAAVNSAQSANLCINCSSHEANQVLTPISVQQARQRSYLHGSVGPYQSLLGPTELKRTVINQNLKVFIGTWNMNGKTPSQMLEDLLLPAPMQNMPDIVVIGTQESSTNREEWEICLQETLGPGHVLFHSAEYGTLQLAVFLRRDLIWVCSVPESDSLGTRAASAFRTKGAVAIGFSIFGTTVLFVNCHLSAHAGKYREREKDLRKIFHGLDLPKELPIRSGRKHKDVTNNYDTVFLFGDLNFRIDKPREQVIDASSRNQIELLLQADELNKCLSQNKHLRGFQESEILFQPTYKYVPGTLNFDPTNQRVPSYTDRILWKERSKKPSITCQHYNSVSELQSSDHLPVWASFEVHLKPGRDTIPLAAGLFNRSVYIEGMKRRAQAWDPTKATNRQHSACRLQ